MQLVVRDFGGLQLGEGQILDVNAEGRPVRGRITIDDDANGLGWYAGLQQPIAEGKYDLYTVLLHEIGHTLGFTQAYGGFASYVGTDAQGNTVFAGPGFTAPLDGTAQHLDSQADRSDLMNVALEPGVRKLPSAMDVQILQASYEAARTGAAGFSTNAAALHTMAEPARLPSESPAGLGSSVHDVSRGVHSLLGADLGFFFNSPQRFDRLRGNRASSIEDELKTTGPFTDSLSTKLRTHGLLIAEPAVEQGDALGNRRAFPWHKWAPGRQGSDLSDDLAASLTAQLDGPEALDAVFAQWEELLLELGSGG